MSSYGIVDKPHLQRFKNKLDVILDNKVNKTDYASSEAYGVVKIDGESLYVDNNGVLHGASSYTLPMASLTTLGGVKVDNDSIKISQTGVISASGKGGVDYDTNEQSTGLTWINGDLIYQKTFSANVTCIGGQWNEICNVPSYVTKIINGMAHGNTFCSTPDFKIENNKLYACPLANCTLTHVTMWYTRDAISTDMYSLTWAEASEHTWQDFAQTIWKEE